MRNRIAAAGMVLICRLAAGQTGSPPWKFEIASVKPAAGGARSAAGPSNTIDPGLVNFRNTSLKNLLIRAYGLRSYQIQGPNWIDTERYDVAARVPEGAPQSEVPAMLQNLLSERFRLVARHETREENVYVLTAGRNGPKLTKSQREIQPGQVPAPNLPADELAFHPEGLAMPGVTMAQFANTIAVLVGHPVLDETGIEGVFDISLKVPSSEFAAIRGAAGPADASQASAPTNTLASALKELGLNWGTKKAPVEHLIVESALKVPLGN